MICVKFCYSILSRFSAIFPAARDPYFQAEEQGISTFKQLDMNCKLKLCEDENCSIVLL